MGGLLQVKTAEVEICEACHPKHGRNIPPKHTPKSSRSIQQKVFRFDVLGGTGADGAGAGAARAGAGAAGAGGARAGAGAVSGAAGAGAVSGADGAGAGAVSGAGGAGAGAAGAGGAGADGAGAGAVSGAGGAGAGAAGAAGAGAGGAGAGGADAGTGAAAAGAGAGAGAGRKMHEIRATNFVRLGGGLCPANRKREGGGAGHTKCVGGLAPAKTGGRDGQARNWHRQFCIWLLLVCVLWPWGPFK